MVGRAIWLGSAMAATALWAGATPASTKSGVMKWQQADYSGAIADWREPAAAGDADAQFNLGQAYKLGKGVPADLTAARDWFRKAADLGHVGAQANLGLILFQQDQRDAAIPWLQKAAAQGEPRAQYVLGIAHFNGDVVSKDWPRGYALMTKAAKAQLPQAITALGEMDKHLSPQNRTLALQIAQTLPDPVTNAYAAQPDGGRAAPTSAPTPVATPATARAARPAPPPAPAGSTAQWRVQLGAFSSPDAARAAWTQARASVSAVAALDPHYVTAANVVRLQAGAFADRAAAQRLCKTAEASGQGCFPVAAP